MQLPVSFAPGADVPAGGSPDSEFDRAPGREYGIAPAGVSDAATGELTVGALCFDVPAVEAGTPLAEVDRLFRRDPRLRGVIVTGSGSPALLARSRLDLELSGPFGYGRSLHARSRAADVLDGHGLCLPEDMSLADAAQRILERAAEHRYDDILVLGPDTERVVTASAVFERLSTIFRHVALHDPLTGLPNRRLLDQHAAALMRAGHRASHTAILYVDLDGFKMVNDTLGHRAGDAILVEFAGRLRSCVRPSDVVARLGGDEFAAMLTDITEVQAMAVAERVVLLASAPFVLDNEPVQISASVGVAMADDAAHVRDITQLDALLRLADGAMLKAKRSGKRRVERMADRQHGDALARSAQLRKGLRRALTHGDGLCLHYQSKLELRGGTADAVEALLRWTDPELGVVSPVEFIPIAEASDQIFEIGRWVLETACCQAAEWLAAGTPRIVSINVSPTQFRDPDLAMSIEATLREHDLPASLLRIEITETSAVLDLATTLIQLDLLRSIGVEVELDDFGTGYSSLSMLRELPLTAVKIDKSFIDQVDTDAADAALIRGVVEAAHALGLTVTAEGVERQAQLDVLRALGCDTAQGYLIARPVHPNALAATTSAR